MHAAEKRGERGRKERGEKGTLKKSGIFFGNLIRPGVGFLTWFLHLSL